MLNYPRRYKHRWDLRSQWGTHSKGTIIKVIGNTEIKLLCPNYVNWICIHLAWSNKSSFALGVVSPTCFGQQADQKGSGEMQREPTLTCTHLKVVCGQHYYPFWEMLICSELPTHRFFCRILTWQQSNRQVWRPMPMSQVLRSWREAQIQGRPT